MVHFYGAMSAAPDPAELAPSRDPAAYGRRRLFTGGLLRLDLLCLICLASAARDRPLRSFRRRPRPRPSSPRRAGRARPAERAGAAGRRRAPHDRAAVLRRARRGADSALSDRVARLETACVQSDAAARSAGGRVAVESPPRAPRRSTATSAAYARLVPGDPDLARSGAARRPRRAKPGGPGRRLPRLRLRRGGRRRASRPSDAGYLAQALGDARQGGDRAQGRPGRRRRRRPAGPRPAARPRPATWRTRSATLDACRRPPAPRWPTGAPPPSAASRSTG